MNYWVLVIFMASITNGYSQNLGTIVKLQFEPTVDNNRLVLNQSFELDSMQLTISVLKFYITDLGFYNDDSLVYMSTRNAYLIDASDITSLSLLEELPSTFNTIKFTIGVDSSTNVSGVLEGDLDPMKGMYWTWQSGYINFKLEGYSPSCPARKNKFQWHIGGYRQPFNTQREVSLEIDSIDDIKIFIELNKILKSVDISNTYEVLSPGLSAMKIADEYSEVFNVSNK